MNINRTDDTHISHDQTFTGITVIDCISYSSALTGGILLIMLTITMLSHLLREIRAGTDIWHILGSSKVFNHQWYKITPEETK
jgi:hypothetical protein